MMKLISKNNRSWLAADTSDLLRMTSSWAENIYKITGCIPLLIRSRCGLCTGWGGERIRKLSGTEQTALTQNDFISFFNQTKKTQESVFVQMHSLKLESVLKLTIFSNNSLAVPGNNFYKINNFYKFLCLFVCFYWSYRCSEAQKPLQYI